MCLSFDHRYPDLDVAHSKLRIKILAEALALQVEDVERSVIRVRHSMWNGKLYSPKTAAGIREVDIQTLLAELLHDHLNGRRSGFILRTKAGTPLARPNVLRRSLHRILGESRFTAEQAGLGFHMPTVAPKLPVAPIAPKEARAQHALTA